MEATDGNVRPEIQALKETISSVQIRKAARSLVTSSSALLIEGPDKEELPVALIENSELLPVDKLTWLALAVLARRGNARSCVPTFADLVNVGCRETVSRSISILRCHRWLTACHASWRLNGARWGGAYILHSRPLRVAEALHLDPNYRVFVTRAARHSNRRIRAAAGEALAEL